VAPVLKLARAIQLVVLCPPRTVLLTAGPPQQASVLAEVGISGLFFFGSFLLEEQKK